MTEKKSKSVEVCSLQKKEKAEKAETNKKNDLQARLVKQEHDIAVLTANVCELSSAVKNLVSPSSGRTPFQNVGDGNQDGHQGNTQNGSGGANSGGAGNYDNRRNNDSQGNYQRRSRRRPPPRCQQCVSSNSPVRCFHCLRCNSDQHQIASCPLNQS